MTGANPQVIEVGTAYSELGATATDNYDGDISGSIIIDATAVNTAIVGSYNVTYDVTDANANAATQVIRTVDVIDSGCVDSDGDGFTICDGDCDDNDVSIIV